MNDGRIITKVNRQGPRVRQATRLVRRASRAQNDARIVYHQYLFLEIVLAELCIPPEARTGVGSRIGIGDVWGV